MYVFHGAHIKTKTYNDNVEIFYTYELLYKIYMFYCWFMSTAPYV